MSAATVPEARPHQRLCLILWGPWGFLLLCENWGPLSSEARTSGCDLSFSLDTGPESPAPLHRLLLLQYQKFQSYLDMQEDPGALIFVFQFDWNWKTGRYKPGFIDLLGNVSLIKFSN